MFLNAVYTFVGEEGVKDKNYGIAVKSSFYLKAVSRSLVELNDKYNNVWHTKQITCFLSPFLRLYHMLRLCFSLYR